MTPSLCPITYWRHGSPARPRELTPDEKLARLAELKAAHVRVAMSRGLKPLRDASDEFYRALFGESRAQESAPGLMRYRHDYAPTADHAAFPGLLWTDAERA